MPTDDHGNLNTQTRDFCHFFHHSHDGCAIDTELVITHQGLSRQLQQNTLMGWMGSGHDRLLVKTE
jgi:hypothetical protein